MLILIGMDAEEPILFKSFPALKEKVPWIPLLKNIPTPVDRLTELENHFEMSDNGAIYIKRDDMNHDIYSGNKLRKFEFLFGDAIKKKKKGMQTYGGVGTNHGLAAAIVSKNLDMKCDLFLANQPLTWHVQRSLLLFDYFGAKIHYAKGYFSLGLKGITFKLFHPKYFMMFPGGSLLLGRGSPLGTIGFINAFLELKNQIDDGKIPKPDIIFVAGGSTGTAAGLIAGCKILGVDIDFKIVAVSDTMFVNSKSIITNCNVTLEYLQKIDQSIPKVKVDKDDFEIYNEYLGSDYGVKTSRGQKAVDLVMELEGKKKGFKLETTYTGKTIAGLIDYLSKDENKSKKVLFWNTYNSNDLDVLLRKIGFDWKNLPKKLHKFYEIKFQCWQINDCPPETREKCPAYLNHEYRFWKVTKCSLGEEKHDFAKEQLANVIEFEDA